MGRVESGPGAGDLILGESSSKVIPQSGLAPFKPSTRQTLGIAIAVCFLTLGVRWMNSALYPIHPTHDEWDHIAENVAAGRGYVSSRPKSRIPPAILNIPDYGFPLIPTASRVPVPVFYFALMYRMFGVSDRSLIIGQGILDALTCAVLFAVALAIFRDRRVATLTAAAWAFYPPELWMANSRYTEPMVAFLLAGLVYVLLIALRRRILWAFGLAGVLWGLGTLSRPTLATLPLFLFPALVGLLRGRLRFALGACLVMALGGALTIAPWVYRNFQTFGGFTISTLGGYNLFRDHYLIDQNDYLKYRDVGRVAKASKEVLDRRFGSAANPETGDQTQLLIDRVYREEAVAKIRKYPARYLILSSVRVLRLWFNVGYGGRPSWKSCLILAGHLILFLLMAKAIVSYGGKWVAWMMPVFAILVHHTLTYASMVGEFRYSIPLTPYLFMIGSYALVCLYKKYLPKGVMFGNKVRI